MEGHYLGLRDHYHLKGCEKITELPALTEAMLQHGYSDEEVTKILGANFLRVYKQVLG